MSATERGVPLSVTYKRASELASGTDEASSSTVLTVYGVEVEVKALSTLRTDAVLVDPETKAHVAVEQQVSDSTARDVGVLISVTAGELDQHNAKCRADEQLSDGVRGTRSNVDEHVMKAVEQCASLMRTQGLARDSNPGVRRCILAGWHEHTCSDTQ